MDDWAAGIGAAPQRRDRPQGWRDGQDRYGQQQERVGFARPRDLSHKPYQVGCMQCGHGSAAGCERYTPYWQQAVVLSLPLVFVDTAFSGLTVTAYAVLCCAGGVQVMFGLAKDDLLELRDEIKGYQVRGSCRGNEPSPGVFVRCACSSWQLAGLVHRCLPVLSAMSHVLCGSLCCAECRSLSPE